jgi:hypothetical protein
MQGPLNLVHRMGVDVAAQLCKHKASWVLQCQPSACKDYFLLCTVLLPQCATVTVQQSVAEMGVSRIQDIWFVKA